MENWQCWVPLLWGNVPKNHLGCCLWRSLFRSLRNDYRHYCKGQILTPVLTPDLPRGQNVDLPCSLYPRYINKMCLKGQSLKSQGSGPKAELKGGQWGEWVNSRGSPCVFPLSFCYFMFPQTTSDSPPQSIPGWWLLPEELWVSFSEHFSFSLFFRPTDSVPRHTWGFHAPERKEVKGHAFPTKLSLPFLVWRENQSTIPETSLLPVLLSQ